MVAIGECTPQELRIVTERDVSGLPHKSTLINTLLPSGTLYTYCDLDLANQVVLKASQLRVHASIYYEAMRSDHQFKFRLTESHYAKFNIIHQ